MLVKLVFYPVALGWLLLAPFASAAAQWGVALGSGKGIHQIIPLRAEVAWDFGPIGCSQARWGLNGLWETSFSIWDGPSRRHLAPGSVTDLQIFTTGPMFRWGHRPLSEKQRSLYMELGIGLSWLSHTEIEGRILSTHFQFEDKLGFGIRFGHKQQYDIALRVYHYSNGSIKRPNSGVNLAMMNVGYWFS